MKDVARRAEVSTATVSAVINGSSFVSEALASRVRQAIAELHYAPSSLARSLRTQTTRLIGVIVADITNPYFAQLVRCIGAELRGRGYSFLLCETDLDPEREAEALLLLGAHGVDGVILAPTAPTGAYDGGLLVPFSRPVVMVDRVVPQLACDSVQIDNRRAAREVTEYLIGLGHRRIGILCGALHLRNMEERLEGFRDALAAAGLSLDPADRIVSDVREEPARRACQPLFARAERPSALFIANNEMTIGAMRALTEAGLTCPADISIAAIDDFPWADSFSPHLTVQAQPIAEIAEAAVRLLLRRLAKRKPEAGGDVPVEHVVLPTRLVIRDSCARHAQGE